MEASKASAAHGDETSAARPGLDLAVWGVPLSVLGVTVAVVVALFYDTFASIVSTWWRSETFAHGFLIIPIAAYLVWDERASLRGVAPAPDYRVLPLLAAVGFGWLCCRLAGVLVLEQYFAVVALPLTVWAVLGSAVTRRVAFPLGFLLLGVPVGEFLIPPLIDFTAWFTVAGLRLTGVPVLQEGNLLTLSGSQWSVVEACSGLRYLIACVTLGLLYAHLTYRSWSRRALCVLASVIVPIIANGFRAYMIVMMGHLSNMKLAVGVDHLIYGWVFFGVVVFIFFWVGSFFREDNVGTTKRVVDDALSPAPKEKGRRFVFVGAAVVLVAAVWPAWAVRAESVSVELASSPPSLFPLSVGEWASVSPTPASWQPHYVGADITHGSLYERDGERIGVHLACYADQKQGAELVNSTNTLLPPGDSNWRQLSRSTHSVTLESRELEVLESVLDSGRARFRVWKWYWIGGAFLVSPYRAKLIEMTGKLSGRPLLACGVVAFTSDSDSAPTRLAEFVDRALPEIEAGLAALPRAP